MTNKKIKKKLSNTPDVPGVYLMKDRDNNVIYVGKALSLKKRINSYFHSGGNNTKNLVLSGRIENFEFIPVASEAEALILENILIKKHQPKYNTNLKDDKSYPMIKITDEKFPAIRIVREQKDGSSIYFGPFTNADLIKRVVKFIRRYYPVRNCRYNLEKKKVRLCTQYYIHRCAGPCEGKISEAEYRDIVQGLVAFFEGNYKDFKKKLKKQLAEEIKNLRFEKARGTKNRIFMLEGLSKRFPLRDEMSLITYGEGNVLDNLKKTLRIKKIPYHIEGYDISNTSGVNPTASKVSFKGGIRDTDNYRKFRIRYKEGINDYKMIEEVLTRRFDSEEERKELPDLILVDGGKGQLNTALKTLKMFNIDVPVVSLAKRNEDIYISGEKRFLRLKSDSPELHLLQAIRNEAHRFAISYHRNLRKKNIR
jgi:excinuclease ABC subunit C